MEAPTYDRRSQPGAITDLSAFALPLTDIGCVETKMVSFFPVATLSEHTNCIEFNISSTDKYLDFASTVLVVEGTFEETEGGSEVITTAKRLFVIDNLLGSLFERVDVFINNTQISHSNFYYVSSYLNILLNSSESQQEWALQAQMFKRSLPGKEETIDNAVMDKAHEFRNSLIKDKKRVHLQGRLDVPITKCKKMLPPGLNITIKLYTNKPIVYMLENNKKPLYRFDFKRCVLNVRHVVVPEKLRSSHEIQAAQTPFIFALDNYDVKVRQIPAGAQSAVFEQIGPIFDRCFCVFIKSKALYGNRQLSPLVFSDIMITKLTLTRGSETHIYDELDIDKHKFGLTFAELQRSLGGENVPFSVNSFKHDTFVVAFNLSTSNPNKSLPTRQENSCRLEIEMSEAIADEYVALFYVRRPIIMQIDASREVTVR